MSWILLSLAGLLEIVWALGLKLTGGFTRFWSATGIGLALVGSVVLLGHAARSLPIGTAYAVWTGIGVLGTTVCGMLFLNEPVTLARLFCLGLIIGGVLGLKMA